ncbi:MAG TPA: ABC transporter permease subunit [Kiritimatiellia bacterium]|nr:ABC transporter permease subunit [Kiritimatiellia bacterium]
MTSSSPPPSPPQIPERFIVSPATLWFDRFMNHFIKVGGLSIIVAVFLIFVFILLQIIPLFRGARVEEAAKFTLPPADYILLGADEWSELPFLADRNATLHFFDITNPSFPTPPVTTLRPDLPENIDVSTLSYNPQQYQLKVGLADGRFTIVNVTYRLTFPTPTQRIVTAALTSTPLLPIGPENTPLEILAYGDSGNRKIAAAIQTVDGRPELHAVTLSQRRSLMGPGELRVERAYDLTEHLDSQPVHLLIPSDADGILVACDNGAVRYLAFDGRAFTLRQTFTPFADLPDPRIASMNFILGDVSVVFTAPTGENRVFSIFRDPALDARIWGHTKTFPALDTGATFFSQSLRNKGFLIGHQNFASLRYNTTETIRWEDTLPFTATLALLGPRYDRLYFLDDRHNLHLYNLIDKHPQAGWKTYFGRIQYEGQAEKSFTWQSTGGRDDFERKLSLVPLIIGTLKGTFYAMIFALPIALLAALYTSQFLKPEIKRIVKPTMEIMASLPSVVLGFLAALWLAPIISNAVPSALFAVAAMILSAFGFGYVWGNLPARIRLRLKPGYEFIAFVPILFLAVTAGWNLGPLVERLFFVVTDPLTGNTVADFRLWFPTVTGLGFEQRNAFVVGFVMGFAVIPIIFTITEDALSNVPDAFRSGSLALGASRWQTAINIVLPTASAGIFSAVMIGLGRAVGETMIVVMATGNTPVTDFNPFTGMRTLSANIAVELPEAPYLGTLYRTLFLGAMVLFLLTFIVNTAAEIMRQRLREKYKAVE